MLLVGNDSFIQNTPEWLEYRKGGIGASDAPIIMGASPWKAPRELFLEKTGKKRAKTGSSPAMDRGKRLEPIARAYYELRSAIEFPDAMFEDDELPYLRASLDGWNEELRVVLEIKCPNREDHLMAIKGLIPPKYIYQLQHQLMVTKAKRLDYFSFDGSRGVHVHVYPDLEAISRMREKEIKFWDCVQKGVWDEL